ncbi:hypothetical protein ACH5RR_018040 [Cinchona calisaya]|uniref:Uncharacterized protein n=1 Tax=Cinchona calisaya TaxID=153742 RepID=A0ABD2ZKA8_9GENT
MMRPFTDTRKGHALVLQQERQADVVAKRDISAGHHAMQSSSVPQTHRPSALLESGTPKRLLKCSHCDSEGHLIDRCFYLHGFPVGHKLQGKNVKPKGKRPSAHNTQTNDVETPKAPATVGATFTTEEYNQLMLCFAKETTIYPNSHQHSNTSNNHCDFVHLPKGGKAEIKSVGSIK